MIAALVATTVALVIGGLLFRSIVAPLRHLTTASQAIAEGDLSARAPVQGRNEVAQLADAGQLYLHTALLDLGPFLREMVKIHRIQAQERGVDLALETPSSFPLVEAHDGRLWAESVEEEESTFAFALPVLVEA